jgi:hypothetical protein
MTNLQLYFAVGIPTIAVLASIVVSLVQISGIREEMRGLRREWNAKVGGIIAKIDILLGI